MRDIRLSPWMLHLIGAAGCALILGAGYVFGVRPVKAEESQLRQRRQMLAQFATTRQTVADRNARLSDEETRLRQAVARLKSRFAAGNFEDELLKTLSRSARNTNTQLLDFQPGGLGRINGLQTTIVRISLRGSYAAIGRFFAELQASPRLRRITQLQMQPVDRTSGRFDVRIEIQEFHAAAGANATVVKGVR